MTLPPVRLVGCESARDRPSPSAAVAVASSEGSPRFLSSTLPGRRLAMSFLPSRIVPGSAAVIAAILVTPPDARACGGCFHEAPMPGMPPPETTVVIGHRMALAISTTQTVLWDQVKYSGSPASFAWVLPIRPGARLELSNDAWFEALDAATSTHVTAPSITCASFGGPGPNGFFDEGGASRSGCDMGCGSSASNEFGFAAGAGGAGNASTGTGFVPPPPPPVTVVHEGAVG